MTQVISEPAIIRNPCPGPVNPYTPIEREEIERPLAERFEKIAAQYAARPAVKTPEQAWTYDELNRHANRLARAILANGGGAGRPIALYLSSGYAKALSIIAVLKTGGAYMPVDYNDPTERAQAMLRDAESALMVTETACLAGGRELAAGGALLNLDACGEFDETNLNRPVQPDSLVGIFFTSGSSGVPKGVVQSHRNLMYHVWLGTNEQHITPEERWAMVTNFSNLIATGDIVRSLLNGATLCPLDVRERGVRVFARWLADMRITNCRIVPTLFRNLCAVLTGQEDLSGLRIFGLAGEPVQLNDIALYRRHLPDTCLLRLSLGATEVGGGITTLFMDKKTEILSAQPPVGFAVPGVELAILDEAGEPVAPGEDGELAVGGKYISPGYWRRPELTAEKFFPDPHRNDVRWYRTGDIGRLLPDGCLMLLGRKDNLVKMRGLRVELTEVETALLKVQGVRQAAVVARPDGAGDHRLVAYLIAEGEPPTVTQLHGELSQRLPLHMMPSSYVFLDKMPVTSGGKLDRAALPVPSPERPRLATDLYPPRNELEKRLLALWEQTLEVHPIGLRDNFFELGGHSLAAARLMAAIEKDFELGLPLSTLLESPTVELLAAHLQRDAAASRPRSPMVELQTGTRAPLFCVEAKNAGLFVHLARRLGAARPVYGFHPLGLPTMPKEMMTVEWFAARYLEEIRRVQPKGPYQLCGLCAGGTMAFEMARQLQAQGESVPLLALFDGFIPEPRTLPVLLRRFITRMRGRGERRASREAKTAAPVMKYIQEMNEYSNLMQKANRRAILGYRPESYQGRMLLFLSEKPTPAQGPDRRQVWASHASDGAEFLRVTGDHEDMLREPHVAGLAKLLAPRLLD